MRSIPVAGSGVDESHVTNGTPKIEGWRSFQGTACSSCAATRRTCRTLLEQTTKELCSPAADDVHGERIVAAEFGEWLARRGG
jgi:hypothetical protein